jgi:cell division GTPase FtsZ
MEMGTQVVVLGIGGAGSKMVSRLASANPPNAELIALDTDKSQLQSLSPNVKTIAIGDSLSNAGSGGVKSALTSELQSLDASVAIILAGLGGKVGSLLSGSVADICSSKGMFTLIVATYPLMKMGGSAGAEAVVETLRHHSNGVVVVDNNLHREGDDTPFVERFDRINDIVCDFVTLLLSSISGAGYMNLTEDELRHFFYGDYFFPLAAGSGRDFGSASGAALDNAERYMGHSGVERMLVMTASPSEVGVEEMRALNELVQGRFKPEGIKWVGAYANSDQTGVITVSAVKELPLIKGVELPVVETKTETIEPAIEEASTREETAAEAPDAPVELTAEPDAEQEVIIETEVEAEIAQSIQEADKAAEEKAEFFSFKSLEYKQQRPQLKFKPPALVGIRKAGPEEIPHAQNKPPQKQTVKTEGVEKSAYYASNHYIDDIVSDLVGESYPKYGPKQRKESQKRLGDYDDIGVDWV